MSFKKLTELPGNHDCFAHTALAIKETTNSPICYFVLDETCPDSMHRYDVDKDKWHTIALFEAGKIDRLISDFSDHVWILKMGKLYCWQHDNNHWQPSNYNLKHITHFATSKMGKKTVFAIDSDNKLYSLSSISSKEESEPSWESVNEENLPNFASLYTFDCTSNNLDSIVYLQQGKLYKISHQENRYSSQQIDIQQANFSLSNTARLGYAGTSGHKVCFFDSNNKALHYWDRNLNVMITHPFTDNRHNPVLSNGHYNSLCIDVGGYHGAWIAINDGKHVFF